MGRPITYFNTGPEIDNWEFNTHDLEKAYMNNVLIFQKKLYLTLPHLPGYSSLNLRDFIDARNPLGRLNVTVTLPTGYQHPTIYSGDLSGLWVSLVIEGHLEAGTRSQAALDLSSDLWLYNNGRIRGYGGNGGKGGKGHVGATTTSGSSGWVSRGRNWKESCTACVNSSNIVVYIYDVAKTSCISCPNTTLQIGNYRRVGSASGVTKCGQTQAKYYMDEWVNTTVTNDGGAGGAGGPGGTGVYYKHNAGGRNNGSQGAPGEDPEDTRGYTGGYGGAGGDWGDQGERGGRGYGNGAYGSYGTSGGLSIKGTGHIQTASWGNLDGGTSA